MYMMSCSYNVGCIHGILAGHIRPVGLTSLAETLPRLEDGLQAFAKERDAMQEEPRKGLEDLLSYISTMDSKRLR